MLGPEGSSYDILSILIADDKAVKTSIVCFTYHDEPTSRNRCSGKNRVGKSSVCKGWLVGGGSPMWTVDKSVLEHKFSF